MIVVIEGVDGAGKTTQTALLKSHFEARGNEVAVFDFPAYDRTPFGRILGRFLTGEFGDPVTMDPFETALLYAGDRCHLRTSLDDALHRGATVLLNRYVPSNMAYGCAKLRLLARAEECTEYCRFVQQLEYEQLSLLRPDAVIVLHSAFTEVAAGNREHRGADDTRRYLEGNGGDNQQDAYEQSHSLQAYVAQEYARLAGVCGWHLISVDDAVNGGQQRTIEEVHELIVKALE